MLPLDLHVLSLSLAFILSQDQTLHCYFCFVIILLCDSLDVLVLFIGSTLFRVLFRSGRLLKRSILPRIRSHALFLCCQRNRGVHYTICYISSFSKISLSRPASKACFAGTRSPPSLVCVCKGKAFILFQPNLFPTPRVNNCCITTNQQLTEDFSCNNVDAEPFLRGFTSSQSAQRPFWRLRFLLLQPTAPSLKQPCDPSLLEDEQPPSARNSSELGVDNPLPSAP